ncbi:MAG: carboxy terminal-processing peptidase [Elusimicrobia bacterium]|nr:carboxy terminal-processing peptidase [Elusimicrobiota bacterium]
MKRPFRLIAAVLAFALAAGPAAADVHRAAGGPIVAELVSRLLEQTHYTHKRLDAEVSRQFLKNYIDSYDYNHMILLQSDVDEFTAKYGDSLGQMAKDGDVDPAYEIYDRVLQRLKERAALVKTLAASTFTFTSDESVVLDRHKLPWPATEQDAARLWRLRIKHEYLLEKIARDQEAKDKAAAKKKEAAAKKDDVKAVAVSSAPAKAAAKPEKEKSIAQTIVDRYDRLLRSYNEYDGTDILQDYLDSLTHVYDPHTDYLAESTKENFDISMKLSLVGIGAVLRSEDGYAKIVSLVPGGPAATGKKLKPNDRIEAVAQGDGPFVEVVGMKLDRIVEMIRGEKGTLVRLRVIPSGASESTRVVIPIVRAKIKLTDQEARARVYTLPGQGKDAPPERIGVLNLPSFYADMNGGEGAKSLTRDTKKLLDELERRGVDAVVVDLRRDGGGSLAEAVTLTGLFIKEGPVVQVKDSRGTIRVLSDTDPSIDYSGPLVVLTSRESASAAEIFTAAMQDYGRAVIVGDKSTFGKGTVQSVLELDDYLPPAYREYRPGALKLTVQKFYRISGGSTQNKGVTPDIHLPSGGDVSDMTEADQPDALPYDQIPPAQYERVGSVDGKLETLEKESAARVKDSQEFKWIREDLARWEKQQKDKSVTLNEAKLLAERKADEDRHAERKKIRAELKEKPYPFQEITLESIGKPASAVAASSATATDDDDETDGTDMVPGRSPNDPDAVLNETLRIARDLAALSEPAPVASNKRPGRSVAQ